MGVASLCSAVANTVKHESDQDHIQHGKISGSMVQVAGRLYPYTVAVDIPVDEGEWVYAMLTDHQAVVVGK